MGQANEHNAENNKYKIKQKFVSFEISYILRFLYQIR